MDESIFFRDLSEASLRVDYHSTVVVYPKPMKGGTVGRDFGKEGQESKDVCTLDFLFE